MFRNLCEVNTVRKCCYLHRHCFHLGANKAPQPPIESTLLRQEDVETLVGLIRDIRYDLSMQVRPYASHGATKIVTITIIMMIVMQVNVPQVCFQYMKSVSFVHFSLLFLKKKQQQRLIQPTIRDE